MRHPTPRSKLKEQGRRTPWLEVFTVRRVTPSRRPQALSEQPVGEFSVVDLPSEQGGMPTDFALTWTKASCQRRSGHSASVQRVEQSRKPIRARLLVARGLRAVGR